MDLQSKRTKLGAGPQSTVDRALYFADQNKRAKKLDEALKSVQDAETALRTSQPGGSISTATLKVWYAEADILAAEDRIAEALAALDTYDLHAVDEERAPAEALRNQLLFNLNTSLKNLKTRLQAAWSEGSFSLAYQLAAQGLKMDAEDADLLYYAGMAALIERAPKLSHDLLTHYLEASDTLDANAEQRALVSRLVASAATSAGAAGRRPQLAVRRETAQGSVLFPNQPRLPAAHRPHRRIQQVSRDVRMGWRTVESPSSPPLKTPHTPPVKRSSRSATKTVCRRWCGPPIATKPARRHPPIPTKRTNAPPYCCSTARLWIPSRSSASPERTWRWQSRATRSSTRSYGRSSTTSGSPTTISGRVSPRPGTERPHGFPRRAGTRIRMERRCN